MRMLVFLIVLAGLYVVIAWWMRRQSKSDRQKLISDVALRQRGKIKNARASEEGSSSNGLFADKIPIITKSSDQSASLGVSEQGAQAVGIIKTAKNIDVIDRSFKIQYLDSSGNVTKRVITVKNIKRLHGVTHIEAFCHLRNEMRTFSLERIFTYIVDTETGGLIDPELLSWQSEKQLIPAEKAKQALFLEITEKTEGWFVHDPYVDISTKQKRKELRLIPYNQHRDAYCIAIDKTIESGHKVLCIYLGGKYKIPKGSKNANLIDIYPIDLSKSIGVAKSGWLYNLRNQ